MEGRGDTQEIKATRFQTAASLAPCYLFHCFYLKAKVGYCAEKSQYSRAKTVVLREA
jgi:hypothetical protein